MEFIKNILVARRMSGSVFFLIFLLTGLVISYLSDYYLANMLIEFKKTKQFSIVGPFLFLAIDIILIASCFCKRLQDFNIDGKKWTVIFIVIYFVILVLCMFKMRECADSYILYRQTHKAGFLTISRMEREAGQNYALVLSILRASLLVFSFKKGTPGENDFGHVPFSISSFLAEKLISNKSSLFGLDVTNLNRIKYVLIVGACLLLYPLFSTLFSNNSLDDMMTIKSSKYNKQVIDISVKASELVAIGNEKGKTRLVCINQIKNNNIPQGIMALQDSQAVIMAARRVPGTMLIVIVDSEKGKDICNLVKEFRVDDKKNASNYGNDKVVLRFKGVVDIEASDDGNVNIGMYNPELVSTSNIWTYFLLLIVGIAGYIHLRTVKTGNTYLNEAKRVGETVLDKTKEFVNEENVRKAKDIADERFTKTKEAGETVMNQAMSLSKEGFTKVQEVVNEENFLKAKQLADESMSNVMETGETALRQAKNLGQEGLNKFQKVVKDNTQKNLNDNVDVPDLDSGIVDVTSKHDAKSLYENLGFKEVLLLAGALFAGLSIGFGCNYSSTDKPSLNKDNITALFAKLDYGTAVKESRKCFVYANAIPLRSEPSMLKGDNLAYIAPGTAIDYIETVASKDTNPNTVIASHDLEILQLFHRSIKVLKGTPMTFEKVSGDFYYCSFNVNGKHYRKGLYRNQIVFPYLGQWNKVRYEGKEGYVMANDVSEPAFVKEK